MIMEPQHLQTAATGVGFLLALGLGLFFTGAKFSRNNDVEKRRQDKSKEQEAKASFRVRRQNLVAISGRGNNKKKRQKIHKGKGKQQAGRNDNISYDGNDVESSWLGKLMYWIRQIISYALSSISCGYIKAKQDNSNDTSKQGNSATKVQSPSQLNKRSHTEQSIEGYYNDVIVVGLDCEMVGGGRGGWKSLLARCSLVTLDGIPHDKSTTKQTSSTSSSSLEDNLIVLYDKYIIPKAKITDYRTEWSGITKDTYKDPANSPIPIVSFNQCQNEISQLFSSIDGKRVVVVGHALENDFEALEIEVCVSFLPIMCLFRITCLFVFHHRVYRTWFISIDEIKSLTHCSFAQPKISILNGLHVTQHSILRT